MDTQHPKKKFAFVVHYVEVWNWLLPFFKHLNDNPYLAVFWIWLAPLCLLMSFLYLVTKQAYVVIDEFVFAGIPGDTLAVRNFGRHYADRKSWDLIKDRVCQTVLAAQERGATVIGLGALNKAEWLTDGGKYIMNKLGNQLKVPLVHGDTLTAAVVFNQALELIERFRLREQPVFLIGPTSKIGRAVGLSLAARGIRVKMFTNGGRRYESIREEAGPNASKLEHVTDLESGWDCTLWITGKAIPGRKELLKYLPRNAITLNFSVPDPMTPKVPWMPRLLQNRSDVLHLDGGLMAYDPKSTTMWNRIRLVPGLTYACHAGTIVHAAMEWKEHEVEQVEIGRMELVLQAAFRVGFSIPPWTSFLRPAVLPAQVPSEPFKLSVGT